MPFLPSIIVLLILFWSTIIFITIWVYRATYCVTIPTVSSGIFANFHSTWQLWRQFPALLKDGHLKHPNRLFQVRHPDRWVVYVTDPTLVKEIADIRDGRLSLLEAVREILQTEHTGIYRNHRIISIIQSQLSRKVLGSLPQILEGASKAYERHLLDANQQAGFRNSSSTPAYDILMKITSEVLGYVFIDGSTAMDPKYNTICSNWVQSVMNMSCFINAFPLPLKPLAVRLYNPCSKALKDAIAFMTPIITLRNEDLKHAPDDDPDDFLGMLLRDEPETTQDASLITRKFLSGIFAALHTTSSLLTHVVFHLASCETETIDVLRAEFLSATDHGRLTKADIDNMPFMDSFLKEALRVTPIAAVSVLRKTTTPLTLSDGSYLQKDTVLMCSPVPTHFDDAIYKDSCQFQPFRFVGHCGTKSSIRPSFTTQSLEYFPWGYGVLTCPGRFIASALLKILIGSLIVKYDLKLEGVSGPLHHWRGPLCLPDRHVRLLCTRHERVDPETVPQAHNDDGQSVP